MTVKVLKVKGTLLIPPDAKGIGRAARIIRRGGLVAFPTETVYGLGAAATCEEAVSGIFAAKGRPADNPLIVHVSSLDQVRQLAVDIPSTAFRLMDRFWPGPLSLVLTRSPEVTDAVSAGLPTVALRMPAHPVALGLIRAAAIPIAAPSANRSSRPSPTTACHVLEDLAGRIDAVIDGGSCAIGVESTVLDLTGLRPVILRPGGVSREELESLIGPVETARLKNDTAPLSPGMKYRHYAPLAPLILITGTPRRRAALIRSLTSAYRKRGMNVGLLSSPHQRKRGKNEIARMLYSALRRMDSRGVDIILAEGITTRGIGEALMNRLQKAALRVIKT